MAYKFQQNPGLQDSQSLKSNKSATHHRSRASNGTLVRNDVIVRHREREDNEMSGGARCCFGFLVFIAQILLHGVVGLVLFWVIKYHSKSDDPESPSYSPWPFSWKTDPDLEFNLHPVLMILGFIYFMGQAMLMYRTCRCCRRIWSKLLHTTFHLLAAPCIAIGFIATYDYHNDRLKDNQPAPIPHFYSIHSWMGLTTMGLFALQFLVGFFSFLLLLCCESATASFRAALVPIHSTFGITTFVMAVATACTGLTEKAFFSLSAPGIFNSLNQNTDQANSIKTEPDEYEYDFESKPIRYKGIADLYFELPNEAIIVNTIGAALVGLAILMPCILKCDAFRKGLKNEADEDDSDIE